MNNTNREIIIKFTADLFSKLHSYLLQNELEQICFLFCHTSDNDDSIVVLPKKIIAFPTDPELLNQHQAGIRLDKDIVNAAYLRFIESEYTALINCHSHPFDNGNVWFSTTDDHGDANDTAYILSELPKGKIQNNKNPNIYSFSMVFGQKTIAARTYSPKSKSFSAVSKIVVLGEPIRNIYPTNNQKKKYLPNEKVKEILNRQILAFGSEGGEKITELTVAIVGLGGLGSILAEGLCRLGVRRFVLLDFDKLELSNMNRWQGATIKDDGKLKIDICKKNLENMFSDVYVKAINYNLFSKKAIDSIKNTDCLVGGLDNEETRYFLNRISLQFLIPYVDGGVVIRSENSKVSAIDYRVGLILPGLTRCFDCSVIQYYDKQRVLEYFLDPETRKNMELRGYIKSEESIKDPAVYPLNMAVSSYMLFEFLNLFTAYKPLFWNISTDYLDLNNCELKKSLNTIDDYESPTGDCLNCEDYIATGDSEPLTFFLQRDKNIKLPKI